MSFEDEKGSRVALNNRVTNHFIMEKKIGVPIDIKQLRNGIFDGAFSLASKQDQND